MGKLLRFLQEYKKESVLGPLFKLLEASFELMVPLVVASVVDVGIRTGNRNFIIGRCLLLAALGLIGLLCSVTAQFFAARAAVGFGTKLRQALFAQIQGLSFGDCDKVGTATLITRITGDVNQVQSGVNLVLRLFLRSPFIVFGAMVMAFTVDRQAAVIFAVLIPLLSVIVFAVILTGIPLFRKIQGGLDRVMRRVRENLTGVRVIRAFCREEAEREQFNQESDALLRMQLFIGRITGLLNPLTLVVVNISIIVLLYTGGMRVQAGWLTVGAVIALVNYLSQILVELIKLANMIVTVTRAFASGNRIAAVFAIPGGEGREEGLTKKVKAVDKSVRLSPGEGREEALTKKELLEGELPRESSDQSEDGEKKQGIDGRSEKTALAETNTLVRKQPEEENYEALAERSGENYIEFKGVSFKYPEASEEALSEIDFTVAKGETVGIIGGTGAGKSTLIHLLPRFYEAEKGKIYMEGKDTGEIPVGQLRSRIGMAMQKPVLFQGTVKENLLMGRDRATEEELWEALRLAQAAEFLRAKEGQLEARVEQEGRNFSGGQRQRLAIARALVRKPEILILDDSASALDYLTEAALRQALAEIDGETTVFIVSQRASSVWHADKIVVLEDGRMAGVGSHRELLATCPVYREIYDSQFDGEIVAESQRDRSIFSGQEVIGNRSGVMGTKGGRGDEGR